MGMGRRRVSSSAAEKMISLAFILLVPFNNYEDPTSVVFATAAASPFVTLPSAPAFVHGPIINSLPSASSFSAIGSRLQRTPSPLRTWMLVDPWKVAFEDRESSEGGGVNEVTSTTSSSKEGDKDQRWNEEHLSHGAKSLHEETDDEAAESLESAAFDAHDCTDPGMEAAATERAVAMTAEIARKMKKEGGGLSSPSSTKQENRIDEGRSDEQWNEEHLVHGANNLHEETNEEAEESRDAAAFDARDCSDPGMEAAAMEWSVVVASDAARRKKEETTAPSSTISPGRQRQRPSDKRRSDEKWNEEHLVHGADNLHEETDDEVAESEDAAAFDAHDCSDPGMEAAASERAVAIALEMAHRAKKEAAESRRNDPDRRGKKA